MFFPPVLEEDLAWLYQQCHREFARLAGKRVLLTGGAGFLGYYLVLSILYWNQRETTLIDLTVYDTLPQGCPFWLEPCRHQLTLIQHDISRGLLPNSPSFDFILHAASYASPSVYRRYPLETVNATVWGWRHLLEYSVEQARRGQPLTGILLFSSSEIYGDPESSAIPTKEDYPGRVSCIGPRACYDEAKRFSETLAITYRQAANLPIVIVRPFNHYGPGLKLTDQRVIADFFGAIFSGRDIVLYSDGTPTRTFCYIRDGIRGCFQALIHGVAGEAYNIGMPEPEISIRELANIMQREARQMLNYSGKVMMQRSKDTAYLTDNPQRRCPDIQKAREVLGFSPSMDLISGLRRTFLWYQAFQG